MPDNVGVTGVVAAGSASVCIVTVTSPQLMRVGYLEAGSRFLPGLIIPFVSIMNTEAIVRQIFSTPVMKMTLLRSIIRQNKY